MPNPAPHRLTMFHLVRRGCSSVSDHRRLALAVYLVQLLMSVAAAAVIARALANALGRSPLFDKAVDGNLLAMLIVLREHATLFATFIWIGIGTAAVYSIVSWYLVGGFVTVFIERPLTWRQRVERFGAGGASLFFPYLRLAVLCMLPYPVVGIAVAIGLDRIIDGVLYQPSLGALVWSIVLNLLPGALLCWIATTSTAYARIDLARHRGSSALALLRAYRTIFTSPTPLAHTAVYWAYFAGVSALYVGLATSFGWSGTLGALALLLVRQLASLSRFGGKLVLPAGQVELSPRRSAETKPKVMRDRDAV